MPKEIIRLDAEWDGKMHFSNGVKVGNTIWVAGQGGLGGDGKVVAPGDIEAQTRQALRVSYRHSELLDWLSGWLSASPRADVPIPSGLVSTLRRWKLQCPRSPHDLVFPKLDGSRRSEPAPSTISPDRSSARATARCAQASSVRLRHVSVDASAITVR